MPKILFATTVCLLSLRLRLLPKGLRFSLATQIYRLKDCRIETIPTGFSIQNSSGTARLFMA